MPEAAELEKSVNGLSRIGFIFDFNDMAMNEAIVTLTQDSEVMYTFMANSSLDENAIAQTEVQEVVPGTYQVMIKNRNENEINGDFSGTVQFKTGGCYVVVLQSSLNGYTDASNILNFQVTAENGIHMLWQIPQYFLITVAEILVSVTGLQFSFTQAPLRMRSVLGAMWQFTVAFGDLIVVLVTQFQGKSKQSDEFFLFAGLMAVDMILFSFLAMRYKYVTIDDDSKEQLKFESNDSVDDTETESRRENGK